MPLRQPLGTDATVSFKFGYERRRLRNLRGRLRWRARRMPDLDSRMDILDLLGGA